jgi:hypothetical protein
MSRSFIPILALLLLACGLRAQTASSASFSLESASFAAAAGHAASASFAMDGLMGADGPVGASSSPGYLFQGGPHAFLGVGPVPMLLGASLTFTPDAAVRLEWSGSETSYTIYRATDCATVGASPVATQPQNSFSDPASDAETLVCYLIQ